MQAPLLVNHLLNLNTSIKLGRLITGSTKNKVFRFPPTVCRECEVETRFEKLDVLRSHWHLKNISLFLVSSLLHYNCRFSINRRSDESFNYYEGTK